MQLITLCDDRGRQREDGLDVAIRVSFIIVRSSTLLYAARAVEMGSSFADAPHRQGCARFCRPAYASLGDCFCVEERRGR